MTRPRCSTRLACRPATVNGSSAGIFTLCLLIRRPQTVRGAVLHKRALVRLFDEPKARGAVTALVGEAMEAGGIGLTAGEVAVAALMADLARMLVLGRLALSICGDARPVRDAQLLGDEVDRRGRHVGGIGQEPAEHPDRALLHREPKPV
jgi:hypothetical protein